MKSHTNLCKGKGWEKQSYNNLVLSLKASQTIY